MAKKKKLLHIVEAMGGGVFTYIVDLSNKLCDEYDIYVAHGVREEIPGNFREYFDERITLIRVNHFTREIHPINDVGAIREIRRIVRQIQPDIIHLHSSKAGVIGRMSIRGNYKKLYTPHGYSFLMQDTGRGRKMMYYAIEKILGKCKCTTVACGYSEYEEAQKITKNVVCIHNGIDLGSIDADIKKAGNVKTDAQDDEGLVVMTLGRICEQKNPKLFNEIAEKMPNVKFLWIGDGELRDVLSSKNIEITGWLERGRAVSEALRGKVFLLTSLYEGLPISLLEAMYMKKVCVVSNVTGNRDVIHNDVNGYLCDTVEDFVNAITTAMSENNKNDVLIQNAYNDVLKEYNSDCVGEKYMKVYNG